MIDLDDLEQNLDWHDSRMKNPEHGVIYSLDYNEKDALRELITRLRQAEKDAARYRCIKALAKVIECEEFDMDMLDGQDLDAMVDECMEAMNGSNN